MIMVENTNAIKCFSVIFGFGENSIIDLSGKELAKVYVGRVGLLFVVLSLVSIPLVYSLNKYSLVIYLPIYLYVVCLTLKRIFAHISPEANDGRGGSADIGRLSDILGEIYGLREDVSLKGAILKNEKIHDGIVLSLRLMRQENEDFNRLLICRYLSSFYINNNQFDVAMNNLRSIEHVYDDIDKSKVGEFELSKEKAKFYYTMATAFVGQGMDNVNEAIRLSQISIDLFSSLGLCEEADNVRRHVSVWKKHTSG